VISLRTVHIISKHCVLVIHWAMKPPATQRDAPAKNCGAFRPTLHAHTCSLRFHEHLCLWAFSSFHPSRSSTQMHRSTSLHCVLPRPFRTGQGQNLTPQQAYEARMQSPYCGRRTPERIMHPILHDASCTAYCRTHV